MEIFAYFFLGFFSIAAVMAVLTKKSFIYCLGNMLVLAAVIIVIWSFIIDDGSRRGMEALVLAIMWGMAAGSFLVGLMLRKIGSSSGRKSAIGEESAVKAEDCAAQPTSSNPPPSPPPPGSNPPAPAPSARPATRR